jgi:hypothetical protein
MLIIKIIKTLLIEDFFHLPPVSTALVVHLELRISPQIFEKFETTLMVYSRAWGKLIHKKTWSQKSRGTVPLGQCQEIFCFRFFSWIIFPQAPENNFRVISNFFQKFVEIFASKGASSPVSTKPVANLPLVSKTPAENLPPVSTTLFASDTAGVFDTCGK